MWRAEGRNGLGFLKFSFTSRHNSHAKEVAHFSVWFCGVTASTTIATTCFQDIFIVPTEGSVTVRHRVPTRPPAAPWQPPADSPSPRISPVPGSHVRGVTCHLSIGGWYPSLSTMSPRSIHVARDRAPSLFMAE